MVSTNDLDHSLYNADELVPPQWLNREFLAEVLRQKEAGQDIQIVKMELSPGSGKNDHYASIMFRARVHYRVAGGAEKLQSMIVKTAPEAEGTKKEMMGAMPLFETEIRMYTETLPQIDALLTAAGEETRLAPSILFHSLTPRECIIFDDLTQRGYTTIAKEGLSLDEMKVVLLKLAKLHAVTFKLAQEGDTSVTAYTEGSFNTKGVLEMDMTKNAVAAFKDMLSKYEDLRMYVPHLERVEKDVLSNCTALFNAHKDGKHSGIAVLNHGDFHLKNMMIKKDQDKLQDIMLLDFQLCIFGSPALDFIYAVNMMFSHEMRRDHRDELFYFYVTQFQRILRLLKFQGHVPTMSEFQMELLKHKHWELFLAVAFLPMTCILTDGGGDISQVIESESYRRTFLDNPGYQKDIRVLLPRFLHQGYFEN